MSKISGSVRRYKGSGYKEPPQIGNLCDPSNKIRMIFKLFGAADFELVNRLPGEPEKIYLSWAQS